MAVYTFPCDFLVTNVKHLMNKRDKSLDKFQILYIQGVTVSDAVN